MKEIGKKEKWLARKEDMDAQKRYNSRRLLTGLEPVSYSIPSASRGVAVRITYSFWKESLAFCGSTRY
jgi:hypothetical protein